MISSTSGLVAISMGDLPTLSLTDKSAPADNSSTICKSTRGRAGGTYQKC